MYTLRINAEFSQAELSCGVYIVVTEAKRIPPHIGMMVNGKYSSLTVKGKEIEVPVGVVFKNIMLRKIPSFFIRIREHPVFSSSHLNELLVDCVDEFKRVEADGTTCLSPVKSFFKEGYQLCTSDISFLFQLLPDLEMNGLITGVCGFNLDRDGDAAFALPVYTFEEINERINQVRFEYNNR